MTETMNPGAPIVHANGTDPETLVLRQQEVARAARALRDALLRASPDPRDYYVGDPERYNAAIAAHRARLAAVEEIERAAERTAEAVLDQ